MTVMENNALGKATLGAVVMLLIVAVVLSAISVSVCFSIRNSVAAEKEENTEYIPVIAPAGETTSSGNVKKLLYRVCEADGFIAIKNADGNIVRTLDVRTAFLPEEDREALKAGIEVFSESELTELIGDYAG